MTYYPRACGSLKVRYTDGQLGVKELFLDIGSLAHVGNKYI